MDRNPSRVVCQCLLNLQTKYEDKDENVDTDQTRTVRPVSFTQLEEIDIDIRVPGLSHAVVKEAENFRVKELVKKIESHPHREVWVRSRNFEVRSFDFEPRLQSSIFELRTSLGSPWSGPSLLDLTKPRFASYKPKWKRHQDMMYWVDIQFAQRQGLKFYQTRLNASTPHDKRPPYIISKALLIKSEEITYKIVFVSPRSPPTIFHRDKWTCGLDSDIA